MSATAGRDLLDLLESGALDAVEAALAAEAVGRVVSDSALVRRVLGSLLGHPSAIVREGALFGLYQHVDTAVATKIRELAVADPSAGVRQAASDALSEWDEGVLP